MLRSSAIRLQSDLPQSNMENLLRQRFPLRQRYRAGQGTTVSPPGNVEKGVPRQRFLLRQRYRAGQGTTVSAPSPSVIKQGMTLGGHALLIKLLRSGRLP